MWKHGNKITQKDLEQQLNILQKTAQELEEQHVKVAKKAAARKLDEAARKRQGGKQKGHNDSKEMSTIRLKKKTHLQLQKE